jgi:hypothetical protein
MVMVVRNNWFVLLMMVAGAQSECMELTENIIQNVIFPYLTLQSIARFGRTCKMYQHIFEPGKIKYHAVGLAQHAVGLRQVEENYYRCTQALGRFAQHENKKMFEYMWIVDAETRNKNVLFLEKKLNINLCDKMNVYRKYYGNLEDVENNITEQLRVAIKTHDSDVIEIITKYKKYNIFDLVNDDESLKTAFQALCSMTVFFGESDTILALLPVEDGEQKNKAVEYIVKYGHPFGAALRGLLRKEYLKVDGEYGYKCTLLHYTVLRGYLMLTQQLLKKGADVHAVNQWGRQPWEYAHMFEKEQGGRVIKQLDAWCYEKHSMQSEMIQKCHSACQPWNISQEEADWLRRSCPYSLEKFNLF